MYRYITMLVGWRRKKGATESRHQIVKSEQMLDRKVDIVRGIEHSHSPLQVGHCTFRSLASVAL